MAISNENPTGKTWMAAPFWTTIESFNSSPIPAGWTLRFETDGVLEYVSPDNQVFHRDPRANDTQVLPDTGIPVPDDCFEWGSFVSKVVGNMPEGWGVRVMSPYLAAEPGQPRYHTVWFVHTASLQPGSRAENNDPRLGR